MLFATPLSQAVRNAPRMSATLRYDTIAQISETKAVNRQIRMSD